MHCGNVVNFGRCTELLFISKYSVVPLSTFTSALVGICNIFSLPYIGVRVQLPDPVLIHHSVHPYNIRFICRQELKVCAGKFKFNLLSALVYTKNLKVVGVKIKKNLNEKKYCFRHFYFKWNGFNLSFRTPSKT